MGERVPAGHKQQRGRDSEEYDEQGFGKLRAGFWKTVDEQGFGKLWSLVLGNTASEDTDSKAAAKACLATG